MGRYELTDSEWKAIEPCLPNKPRGVPRVNDRRVLNGIFWVLRSGARWADLPELWAANDHLQSLQSLAEGRRVGPLDGRGHKSPRRERSNDRHVDRSRPSTRCNGKKGGRDRCLGRSRGGLTTKIHAHGGGLCGHCGTRRVGSRRGLFGKVAGGFLEGET